MSERMTTISLRVPESYKSLLEGIACDNYRALSNEILFRLNQSLEKEGINIEKVKVSA